MWGLSKRPIETQPQPQLPALTAFEWERETNQAEPDTWLISFVDVLTLLLTLFVLLLAYQKSANDELRGALIPVPPRIQAADWPPQPALPPPPTAQAAIDAPPQAHSSPAPQPQVETDPAAIEPVDTEETPSRVARIDYLEFFAVQPELPTPDWLPHLLAVTRVAAPADSATETAPASPMADLQERLAQLDLQGRVDISHDLDQLNLEVSDKILFEPASAALTTAGVALLNELLPVFLSGDFRLSVEGHTDNTPINTARYPSNWELSAARATTVTRHLLTIGLKPERVRAIGYADTRPRADNDSAAGRARNRRVAFVLQTLPTTSTAAVR